MKPWARDLALGLLLSVALPVAVLGADSAEKTLLDKANYWRLRDRPDLAGDALNKLLTINPSQPDALYQYGVLQVQLGNLPQANEFLARLKRVAPSSPRITELEATIRAGQISPNDINEARRLAQTGDFGRAAQKYEQSFRGSPPSNYSVEYYQTLAGTDRGWEEARRGLERMQQASPNDPKVQLALAQVLTYREQTRREGIQSLARLSRDGAVGPQANQAWHQGLIWLNAATRDRPLYDQYLAQNPSDNDVRQHFVQATTPGAGGGNPGDAARAQGFVDLQRGNTAAAEREFSSTLRSSPGDGDALGGLGIIRLRQQRFGEARDLLARAMRAAPGQRSRWASAYSSASFLAGLQDARAARDAGNYDRAQSILTNLTERSRADSWNADLLLADVQAKQGNHAAAEQTYRRVLATRPQDPDALSGLYGELLAQGKNAEAMSMADRVQASGRGQFADPGRARAEALRSTARQYEARGDAAQALAQYQQALTTDPKNAWVRLDFARFLARQGQLPQAYAVVDPTASGSYPDSWHAAAIFDVEQNRAAEGLAKIDRVPQASRSGEMNTFREQILVQAEIERAKQLARAGNRAEARDALILLYTRPPVTADKTRLVADALASIGEYDRALQIARENLSRPGAQDKAMIDYADMLLRTGRDAEGQAYLNQIEGSRRLNEADRRALFRLRAVSAASTADRLRQRGDLAGAYDAVSPLLAQDPNNWNLLLAAGRIYAAAGEYSDAMRFVDAAYREEPTNLDVIRGAVGAAIEARDLDRAQAYLAQGLERYPNNARLYYLKAEVARAGGDTRTAYQSLEAARALNQQASVPVAEGTGMSPQGVRPTTMPPNPFRHSGAEPSSPPVFAVATARSSTSSVSAQALSTGAEMPGPRYAASGAAPASTSSSSIPLASESEDLTVPPVSSERPASSARLHYAQRSAGDPYPPSQLPAYAGSARAYGAGPPAPAGSMTYDTPAPYYNAPRQSGQLEPLPPPPLPGYQVQYAPPPYQNVQYQNVQYQNVQYQNVQAPGAAYAPPPYPSAQYPSSQYPSSQYPRSQYPNASYPNASYPNASYPNAQYPTAQYPTAQYQASAYPGAPYQPYAYPAGRPSVAPAPQDSLEADIDRSLATLQQQNNPSIQGGLYARGRTGEQGLSRLIELAAPVEGNFSPWYTGNVRFNVAPTYLTSGSVSGSTASRFGTGLINQVGNQAPRPGSQNAFGVGLMGGYAYGPFGAEVGTTPLGFRVSNLIGNVAVAPTFANNTVQLRVEGHRQAVTDSLLSYAGTRDSSQTTGNGVWGGVVRTGGRVSLGYDDGDFGAYGSGGGGTLTGKNVRDNTVYDANVGAFIRPYKAGDDALKVGLNLGFLSYDQNLRYFSYGQGGYFSPQSYYNFSIPVEYSGRSGRLTYLAGAAIGVQTFHEDRSAYYPNNPGLQALAAAQFGNAAFYPSRTSTGPSFNVKGQLEYALNNGFAIGASASADNARDYFEGIGRVFLRKTFGVGTSSGVLPQAGAPYLR